MGGAVASQIMLGGSVLIVLGTICAAIGIFAMCGGQVFDFAQKWAVNKPCALVYWVYQQVCRIACWVYTQACQLFSCQGRGYRYQRLSNVDIDTRDAADERVHSAVLVSKMDQGVRHRVVRSAAAHLRQGMSRGFSVHVRARG